MRLSETLQTTGATGCGAFETAAVQDLVGQACSRKRCNPEWTSSSTAAPTPNNRGDVRACSQLLFLPALKARTARRLRPPFLRIRRRRSAAAPKSERNWFGSCMPAC